MRVLHNAGMSSLPDAEHLLTLLAVAEAGSESTAAELLGVGQSSVSRRLAALQQLAREPLTRRTAAGTRLTPAGEALLGPARELRAVLQRAAEQLDPERRAAATVRLGITPHLVPRLAGAFGAARGLEVELVEAHSRTLLTALRRGELAAALSLEAPAGGEPGVRTVQVGEERLFVAAHPGEPAVKAGGADGLLLAKARWCLPAAPSAVGDRGRALLRRAGLAAAHQTPVPSPAALRATVLAGAGVGLVLGSELQAEAAAGWLTLAELPFGERADAVMGVWLLTSDALPEGQEALLEDLARGALRA